MSTTRLNCGIGLGRSWLLGLLLLLATCTGRLWAANYYVATTGDDANPGTLAAPFRTIQKAATVAQPGDNVYVRAGVYRETVRPVNSGTNEATRITYQPYNNEQVTITGADLISGVWTQHSGNIWKIDVPPDDSVDTNNNKVAKLGDYQLLVNGCMMHEARWPNNTLYDPSFPTRTFAGASTWGDDTNGTASIRVTNPPPWAVGAKMNLWPGPSYFLRTATVNSITTNIFGQIFLNVSYPPLGHPAYNAKEGDPYFLWGKLQALDAPGEFFFDTSVTPHKLYLWAPHDANPNQLTVELKRRRYAFDLSGRNYITVRGFRIVAANVYTLSSALVVLDGLRVLYASHLTEDVGTWSTDLYGMVLRGYGNTIQNCDIAYSAGSGVGARGRYLTIRNNIITDSDYIGANFAGIYLYNDEKNIPPSGNRIASNTVVNCGAVGIFYNTLNQWTNNVTAPSWILNNRVSSVCLQVPDYGNLYTSGNGSGTEIAYNIFNDNRANASGNPYGYPVYGVTGAGIYLDNGVSHFNVHHNVTFGSMYEAVRVNMAGKNLTIAHNTLLADEVSLNNYFSVPESNFAGAVIINNIFRKPVNTNTNIPPSQVSVTNIFSNTDPLFTNPANNDYTLQAGSPARDTGANLGYPYVGSGPDQGAYEYGAAVWQAGATISPQPLPPPTLWSISTNGGVITLKWLPAPGWRYVIYRTDTSGYGYQVIATNANDTLTYTDSGFTNGGPFYYTLKIERLGVESATYGNELGATPSGNWPSAPTGLQATTVSSSQINLRWTDVATNETGYQVWRKYCPTCPYGQLAALAANATNYSDTGLSPGSTYIYRVRAINAAGASAYSAEASATTFAITTNVVPATVADGVGLSWYCSNNVPYVVQWKPDLTTNSVWSNLTEVIIGSGTNCVVFDAFGEAMQKFYRVLQLPP